MEILEQRVEVLASQAVYATTIRTNYLPAEIIAMCKDGTSESTNPEALRLRKQAVGLGIMDSYLAGRADLDPEVNRLKAELECSNGDFRQLEAMKENLETELKSAKADYAELAKRHDELSAINVENYHNAIQAKAELDRLKTQFSPPKPIFNMAAQTVYGMTLDEVRGLKADRHELRLALEKANRKLSHIKQTLG